MPFTDRQLREIEYHRSHAANRAPVRISYAILSNSRRRWWNAYWDLYTGVMKHDLRGKKALVVGCGFGEDAIYLAKLGAEVYAFDISPESLDIARSTAHAEGLHINFRQSAAESLVYDTSFFDLIFVVDILHHCEVERCLRELQRVAVPGALVFIDEIYTHSFLNRLRNSVFIEKWLYPRLVRFIYGDKPYITDDERKLTEQDVSLLQRYLANTYCKYYYCVLDRVIPKRFVTMAKIDRLILAIAGPLAALLAGRFVMSGRMPTHVSGARRGSH